MMRVVFFGDSSSYISSILFDEILKLDGTIFDLIAVVDTCKDNYDREHYLLCILKHVINKIVNPKVKLNWPTQHQSFLTKLSSIKTFRPQSINSSTFIKELKVLKADYALSFGNPQIMKKALLDVFKTVINYHNSSLPKYRGLDATSWSMTFSEKYTGYSFHEVNEQIDDGNIFVQDEFKIDYTKTSFEIELEKTFLAKQNVRLLFELLDDGFQGYKQQGEISYFGHKEKAAYLHFDKLNDTETIKRLIKIWGGVSYNLNGELVWVTALNTRGEVSRINLLPISFYSMYKKLKKI